MRKSYKEMAELSRESGGRAPKFDVKYFTRREVKSSLENNKHFTHACIELGLMRKGSKSPFNALRNMHKLLDHFKLRTSLLGKGLIEKKTIQCPYCDEKFELNLEK